MIMLTRLYDLIQNNAFFLASLCVVSALGYIALFSAKKLPFPFLRSFFFITANKSTNVTLQLGGMPTNISLILLFLGALEFFPMTADQNKMVSYTLMLVVGVMFYGYLDDRYEIRPIFKLLHQVILATIFSYLTSDLLYPANTVAPFLINFIVVMTALNGVNLLDGLDTMSFKIFAATLIFYTYLGLEYNLSSFFLIITAGSMALLIPFYFLNRAPAKVYLGEIGAGGLASAGVGLANLFCLEMKGQMRMSNSLTLALAPLILPATELGISFLRRFFNNRSPFKGDKLHVHHLLNQKWGLKAAHVGTLYGVFQMALCLSANFVTFHIGAFVGFLTTTFLVIACYLYFGRPHWVGEDFIPINLQNLFHIGLEKKVKIISGGVLTDFQIHLIADNSSTNMDNFKNKNQQEAS
ncbi:MAG: hypothetical protein ACOYL6_06850 [Bacteriovoracaceae bacterium]